MMLFIFNSLNYLFFESCYLVEELFLTQLQLFKGKAIGKEEVL